MTLIDTPVITELKNTTRLSWLAVEEQESKIKRLRDELHEAQVVLKEKKHDLRNQKAWLHEVLRRQRPTPTGTLEPARQQRNNQGGRAPMPCVRILPQGEIVGRSLAAGPAWPAIAAGLWTAAGLCARGQDAAGDVDSIDEAVAAEQAHEALPGTDIGRAPDAAENN